MVRASPAAQSSACDLEPLTSKLSPLLPYSAWLAYHITCLTQHAAARAPALVMVQLPLSPGQLKGSIAPANCSASAATSGACLLTWAGCLLWCRLLP